jgi:hypothetical protein
VDPDAATDIPVVYFDVVREPERWRCFRCDDDTTSEVILVIGGIVGYAWCQQHLLDALLSASEREDVKACVRLALEDVTV